MVEGRADPAYLDRLFRELAMRFYYIWRRADLHTVDTNNFSHGELTMVSGEGGEIEVVREGGKRNKIFGSRSEREKKNENIGGFEPQHIFHVVEWNSLVFILIHVVMETNAKMPEGARSEDDVDDASVKTLLHLYNV